jgi:hypothetical protein
MLQLFGNEGAVSWDANQRPFFDLEATLERSSPSICFHSHEFPNDTDLLEMRA